MTIYQAIAIKDNKANSRGVRGLLRIRVAARIRETPRAFWGAITTRSLTIYHPPAAAMQSPQDGAVVSTTTHADSVSLPASYALVQSSGDTATAPVRETMDTLKPPEDTPGEHHTESGKRLSTSPANSPSRSHLQKSSYCPLLLQGHTDPKMLPPWLLSLSLTTLSQKQCSNLCSSRYRKIYIERFRYPYPRCMIE